MNGPDDTNELPSLKETRALMKLPIDERRKDLAEMVGKIADKYQDENLWGELEGAD